MCGQEELQGPLITQHHRALAHLHTQRNTNTGSVLHSHGRAPVLFVFLLCTVLVTVLMSCSSTPIICVRSIVSCPTDNPHNHTHHTCLSE